jgi:hypothetical protein
VYLTEPDAFVWFRVIKMKTLVIQSIDTNYILMELLKDEITRLYVEFKLLDSQNGVEWNGKVCCDESWDDEFQYLTSTMDRWNRTRNTV